MDPTVRSKLEGIKSQAFALEEYLRSSSNQGTTLNDVAQEAAGYAAKELVRSSGLSRVISPRKGGALVKKYLRERDQAKLRDFKKMREAEIDTRLKTLIEQVSSLLKTLSLPRPEMNENGNSQELLRMMARIYKYSTPQRRLKELLKLIDGIILLDPIENTKIKDYLAENIKSIVSPTTKINVFEGMIRNFLKHTFRDNSNDWIALIPNEIRRKAEQRMRNENGQSSKNSTSNSILDFLNFSDYVKIICDDANWNKYFRKVFPNKFWIKERLLEIGRVRNAIMHSRKLTKDAKMKLNLYINEIVALMYEKGQ